MSTKNHRDLVVWQKAMALVTECYRITNQFPDRERFGLSSQLQRAAVSVPANIAEGNGRRYRAAYVNHLSIAYGSLAEVETHILIGVNLGYVQESDVKEALVQLEEVRRMTAGLIRSLDTESNAQSR